MYLSNVAEVGESDVGDWSALTLSLLAREATGTEYFQGVNLGRRGNILGCCNQICDAVQNKQTSSRGPAFNIGLLPSRSVIVYMQEQTRPSVLAILVLRSYI